MLDMISIYELAAKIGVSYRTIYRMLKKGELTFALRIGGMWRFKKDDVEKWLEERSWNSLGEGQRIRKNQPKGPKVCESSQKKSVKP
jgi:PTS system nitrogen regulatory IIA component